MYGRFVCKIFAVMFGVITFFAPIVGLDNAAGSFAFRIAVLFAIMGTWKE